MLFSHLGYPGGPECESDAKVRVQTTRVSSFGSSNASSIKGTNSPPPDSLRGLRNELEPDFPVTGKEDRMKCHDGYDGRTHCASGARCPHYLSRGSRRDVDLGVSRCGGHVLLGKSNDMGKLGRLNQVK